MRIVTILCAVLLAGCQGLLPLDRWMAQPAPSIMPLWDSYQHCMTATDVDVLIRSVEQLEQAVLKGSEPPDWMRTWGNHVARQPLRTAVDPHALSAACTLRAASILADQDRLVESTALYQHIVAHNPGGELAYYVAQAKDALAALTSRTPALLARR